MLKISTGICSVQETSADLFKGVVVEILAVGPIIRPNQSKKLGFFAENSTKMVTISIADRKSKISNGFTLEKVFEKTISTFKPF